MNQPPPNIKFKLLNRSMYPTVPNDPYRELHKACLVQSKDLGYIFVSCFSDNPSELKLSIFKNDEIQDKVTCINLPELVIDLLCIQLTTNEKCAIKMNNSSFSDDCLLAVLTNKTIYFYDVTMNCILGKFDRFFPRGIRFIPIELKRPRIQVGCDGMLAVVTVGKVFIYNWISTLR